MIPMKWDCIDEILQTFEHYFMQMFDIRLDLLCSVRILFRGTFGRPPIRQYTATFYRESLYTKLIQSCRDGSKLFSPPPPPEASCYLKNPPNFRVLVNCTTFKLFHPRRTSHRRMRCRPTSSPSFPSDMSTFHLKAPTFFTGSASAKSGRNGGP